MKYLYKKDLIGVEGNHKYADFVCENQGRILNEDETKFWFEDVKVCEPSVQEQIIELEGKITPRRLREALLGNSESKEFLKTIESKIAKLRKKL